jgi:hypothetical protein
MKTRTCRLGVGAGAVVLFALQPRLIAKVYPSVAIAATGMVASGRPTSPGTYVGIDTRYF